MIVILDSYLSVIRAHRELTLDDAKFIQRFNQLIREYEPTASKTVNTAQVHTLHPV